MSAEGKRSARAAEDSGRFGGPIDRLIAALQALPNVGPKSAQRMAFLLLQENRSGAEELARALDGALAAARHCASCNNLCDKELCDICADPERDRKKLMVVSMPTDVVSMERARCHDGTYFVLMGDLHSLEGNMPDEAPIERLTEKILGEGVEEVIVGTDFTSGGETTAAVLSEVLVKLPCRVSRLARGLPLGGELEYVDLGTLAQSFYDRRPLKPKSSNPMGERRGAI